MTDLGQQCAGVTSYSSKMQFIIFASALTWLSFDKCDDLWCFLLSYHCFFITPQDDRKWREGLCSFFYVCVGVEGKWHFLFKPLADWIPTITTRLKQHHTGHNWFDFARLLQHIQVQLESVVLSSTTKGYPFYLSLVFHRAMLWLPRLRLEQEVLSHGEREGWCWYIWQQRWDFTLVPPQHSHHR